MWGRLAVVGVIVAAYWYSRAPQTGRVATSLQQTYDYVIVGAGSAGSVLAARLSEDPDIKVLVLEAGDEETKNPAVDIPGKAMYLTSQPHIRYVDYTEPQKNACFGFIDSKCQWIHGRMLGGSSGVNFMAYIRGSPEDYDDWAAAGGCEGWSYKDVLPYFRKAQTMNDPKLKHEPHIQGYEGPIFVEDRHSNPLGEAFVRAGAELGYETLNYLAEKHAGFSLAHTSVKHGTRCSTAKGYLRPAMVRDNLDVAVRAFVHKVIIEEERARGVEFSWRGEIRRVAASREVILSAGALDSPKILMLSGVGPREHLEQLKIPVIKDLPVGNNLQDHLFLETLYTVDKPVAYTPDKVNSLSSRLNYALFGGGPLASTSFDGMAILHSEAEPPGTTIPHIQLLFMTSLFYPDDDGRDLATTFFNFRPETLDQVYGKFDSTNNNGMSIYSGLHHPVSRGTLRLRSSYVSDRPIFDPHYLEEPQDVAVLLSGIRIAQKVAATDAFKEFGVKPVRQNYMYCDHHEYDSDAFWECMIRHDAKTIFHYSGTCKMGAPDDPTAVVDPQLRVLGIAGLRVVDASIMPNVTAANTNAPTIMIGEKAADLIKQSRQ